MLIAYINFNPEKHGISPFTDYRWSSFQDLVSDNQTWLSKDDVIDIFGSKEDFYLATKKVDFDDWISHP